MKLEEEEAKTIRDHLITSLEPLTDADPSVLADYTIALLRNKKPTDALKKLCEENLEEFLNSDVGRTKDFVKSLFEFLEANNLGSVETESPQRRSPTPEATPRDRRRRHESELSDEGEENDRNFKRTRRKYSDEDRDRRDVDTSRDRPRDFERPSKDFERRSPERGNRYPRDRRMDSRMHDQRNRHGKFDNRPHMRDFHPPRGPPPPMYPPPPADFRPMPPEFMPGQPGFPPSFPEHFAMMHGGQPPPPPFGFPGMPGFGGFDHHPFPPAGAGAGAGRSGMRPSRNRSDEHEHDKNRKRGREEDAPHTDSAAAPVSGSGIIVKHIPLPLNAPDILTRNFARFGNILNIQTHPENQSALIHFATFEQARNALETSKREGVFKSVFYAEDNKKSKPGAAGAASLVMENEEYKRQKELKQTKKDIDKKREQLLEQHTQKMRSMLELLKNKNMPPKEREELMTTMKSMQAMMSQLGKKEEKRPAASFPPAKKAKPDTQGAQPGASDAIASATEAGGVSQLEQLKNQLAHLKQEASSLGILKTGAAVAKAVGVKAAGNRNPLSLDNRPTSIKVSDLPSEVTDEHVLKEVFQEYGPVVSVTVVPPSAAIVKYAHRKAAEQAMAAIQDFKTSWYQPAAGASAGAVDVPATDHSSLLVDPVPAAQ